MYHSIIFRVNGVSKNTWDDWKLIPTSRPIVPPREVKTRTVEIPGMNGIIDLTEELTGAVLYGTTPVQFDFAVVDDDPNTDWVSRYNTFVNFLHGRRAIFVLEDELDYFYEGRFTVDWKTGKNFSGVTFSSNVDVYRISLDFDITSDPESVTVALNADAIFEVEATGEKLSYQWQYFNSGSSRWQNSGLTGNQTPQITVKALSNRDGQKYRCVVTNAMGETKTSGEATLTIA